MNTFLLQDISIDWDAFRKQKETLLLLIEELEDTSKIEALEGILHLMDKIQDEAIESCLWEEEEILGKKDQYFEWMEHYKPIENHLNPSSSFNGTMFETFGAELNFILDHSKDKTVWTLIDGEEGQYIVAGIHHVNRLGYFITEIGWEAGNEEFYSS